MYRSLILIFITLSLVSCSSYKSRKPASSEVLSCNELISHFKTINDHKVYNKYKKYSKYNDPRTFQKFESKSHAKIKFWSDTGNRKVSVAQMRHNGAFSGIKTAFEVDTAFAIARQFTSLFYDAETAYFIANRAYRETSDLQRILKRLKAIGELTPEIRLELESYISNNLLNTKSKIKMSMLDGESTQLIKAVASDMAMSNEVMITYSYKLTDIFDQYSVVRKFIDQKYSQGDPKAKIVLEKLSPSKLLSGCHLCGETSSLISPNLASMEVLAKKVNIAQVMVLKKKILREMWLTISSRLPNQYVYQFIDKVLQLTPWLNDSGFRKWLRVSFIDFKDRHRYFPNIDRIVFSEASDDDLVSLVSDIVSSEGNEFLVTFARRVDAHKDWNKVYKWLGENLPEDKRHHYHKLRERMDKAWKEANKRGPVAEWHNPSNSGLMRFIIDISLYTSGLYVSYNYFTLQEIDETQSRAVEVENTEREMMLINEMIKELNNAPIKVRPTN